MLRAGLTGGIGSGKSEVTRRLAGHGAVIIDADKIAREVVEPGTEGLAEIVEAFGASVLLPGGALDRERLGEIVFSDDEKRAVLNAIVHPKVGERTRELEMAAPPDAIVIYDIPLLVENDLAPLYDVVIVVDAGEEIRLDRLVRLRGMAEADAKARMAAQASREERLAAADIVIDNSGALEDLDARLAEVWNELLDAGGNVGRPRYGGTA